MSGESDSNRSADEMNKADYRKRGDVKGKHIQERMYEKRVICVSKKWLRWGKSYLNKSQRRNDKVNLYRDCQESEGE